MLFRSPRNRAYGLCLIIKYEYNIGLGLVFINSSRNRPSGQVYSVLFTLVFDNHGLTVFSADGDNYPRTRVNISRQYCRERYTAVSSLLILVRGLFGFECLQSTVKVNVYNSA